MEMTESEQVRQGKWATGSDDDDDDMMMMMVVMM